MDIQWKWEDMCGPSGLHPWNETSKDFGQCFQELFLQIPVYFIIATISGYFVGYRKDWVVRERTQENTIVFRSFVVLTLIFIPIIELYVLITKVDFILYPIDYFTAGSSCLAWLVHFGYVLALKHRLGPSSRGPVFLLFWWGLSMLLTMIALRTSILTGELIAFHIATLCCHILYIISLIPSSDSRPTFYSPCLVGSQHSHIEYTPLLPQIDEDVLGMAMYDVGCFSKLTFSWVEPLLQKGVNNKLDDPEELFDIPTKYRCSYVGARIDRALIGNIDHYQQYEDVPHEPFMSSVSGYGSIGEVVPQTSTPVTPTSRVLVRSMRRQNVTLLRALHSCFAFQFYSIGFFKLLSDMAGFAGPMLLNKLIIFVEDDSIDQHYGYVYAISLLFATLVAAMFNVHFNWLMSLIGLKMRGAIVSAILRKTLSVTSTELTKSFTVGEITNFMSTDTDRIVNSCPSFHALWSIPLQLFITLFLLYQQVGVSFLAGVAFSVILIPINKVIANKIGQLSTELMKHKDCRVNFISDLLKGIKTVKVHVWEDYFISKVSEARMEEVRYLRGRKYLDAVCVVLWATTPVLVAALTLGTHALRGQQLDAPIVFTTVALINMLIAPLNAFPWVLNGLTEAWVSIKRIQKLLDLPDMDLEVYYDRINKNQDEDKVIHFKKATFSWAKPSKRARTSLKSRKNKGKSKKNLKLNVQQESTSTTETVVSQEPFMLKDIDLEIYKGQLIGITGNVGSGKTSLLHAIIGEMLKKSGDVQITDSLDGFGYVSQKPWLVRGTIRENIIFGKPYDETKFRSVIDACALTEDLNILGWNAHVGEGGCTLSGGQRARIALARALYQDKQVYLLDDVMSGLDARVAQHVGSRCLWGALRGRTRVLVSHAPSVLARAHRVLLMHDGRIIKQGPPELVLNDIEEYMPDAEEGVGEELPRPLTSGDSEHDDKDNVSHNSLDQDEAMSHGTVGWWVIGMYLRSVGIMLSIAILLSLLLMQLSQNFTFLWLTFWVKSKTNSTAEEISYIDNVHETKSAMDHGFDVIDKAVHAVNNTISLLNGNGLNNGTHDVTLTLREMDPPVPKITQMSFSNDFYLEMYFGLAGLNLLFTIMRAFLFAYGGVQAAKKIHKRLLEAVITAKMKFFDITPIGRILNRFSSDTYTVDDSLPFILNILLAQLFSLLGAVCVSVYGLPWLLAVVAPLVLVYYWLQRRYRITSRQLKRLQSVTLSPIYAHFNDTLEGLCVIRAMGSGARWAARGEELTERWQRAALCGAAAAQWLALRLQAPAAALVAAAALLAVLQRSMHAADPGLVGLAISYALSMTSMLANVLNAFTETERELIAVERVGEYIKQIEPEKIDGDPPPYGWPSQGVICFEDVVLKYRSGSGGGVALHGMSFCSRPGERLGVVGRTGAGKSSLLLALLRLAPISAGRVLVDGVDVATLHLHALRSRVGMIPQEPFIFGGSVRENVDPLRQYSDGEVWRAVQRSGAAAAVLALGGLPAPAAPASRGLAQLLCLARALLHRPKILLIDEATANLDRESERLILDTIRSALSGSTVVMVAHRVAGALECARVLVVSGGRALELAAPHDLLADPDSEFYKLVHAHEQRGDQQH